MNGKVAFALTAPVSVLLPFVVPQYSLTVLIEALIFGLFVSTVFTLVVIPVVYFMVYGRRAT